MRRWLLLLFFIFGTSVACRAERIKVKFECTCDDQVGKQYATALRDSLATSPRYVEMVAESEPKSEGSKDKVFHFVISVVSMDTASPAAGRQEAMSVVITAGSAILDQRVLVCGVEVVTHCSAATLANLDKILH